MEMMVGFMRANGKIKCKEMDGTHGQMEENTRGSISMIRNMELEFSNGQMERNIRDHGKMENIMG